MHKSAMCSVCFLIVASIAAASLSRTYTNPVGGPNLRMGDPFILRYRDRYYLYGTSAGDGFKCWTSRNLVDWQPVGYAWRKSADSWGKKDFWAPEVIRYRDKFYMIYSCTGADKKGYRLCLADSNKPEGPFADLHAPLFDIGWSCIDGHIFMDDDGTPYLFFDKVGVVGEPWAKPSTGYMYGIIYAAKLKEDLSGLLGEALLCAQADQQWEDPNSMNSRCNEGAFVLRHAGTYYMTYSAGHYADPNYGIGYATASAPLGPWTKNAANPLVQKAAAAGVSGPGHNSITTSPDGNELFMVYHAHADANRPSGERCINIDRLVFDDAGNLRLIGPTRRPQPMPSGAE